MDLDTDKTQAASTDRIGQIIEDYRIANFVNTSSMVE